MENKDNRYGFLFNFGDGGWNIIMFDNQGNYHAYYSSDEDNLGVSLQHLEDYVADFNHIYSYTIPKYAEFCEKVTDIFSLKNNPVEPFVEYLFAYRG